MLRLNSFAFSIASYLLLRVSESELSELKYAVASLANQSDQLACILDNSFASGKLGRYSAGCCRRRGEGRGRSWGGKGEAVTVT